MKQNNSILEQLSHIDRSNLMSRAARLSVAKGTKIFSTGDHADYIYFIESGSVSVNLDQFNSQSEINIVGPGSFFGEMAILNNTKRNATVIAAENCELLQLDKQRFLEMLDANREIANKIAEIQAQRSHELALQETITRSSGIKKNRFQVSIKGDPSLRETALFRERYQSVVDKAIADVIPIVEKLLIERCVFRVYIGLHNGEVHTSSIFNPFHEEIHPVNKLVDDSYLDRHFARVPFERKTAMIRRTFTQIERDPELDFIPKHLNRLFRETMENWNPVSPEEIREILAHLPTLRRIPNFYIRALSLSMMHDAIRMQFNCDGTHIISNQDYGRFLQDNIEAEHA